MPTFTGETGERIRNMEARLAALEAAGGGGVDPKTGLFSAYRYFDELTHPGGNLFIVNDTQDPSHPDSPWYDVTTGRYTPKLQGWYRLTAGVTIKSPVPSALVGCSVNMYRRSGGGNTQSFLMNTLQHIPTYGFKATKIVLSGSCIVYADGVDYSFQPSVVMDGASGIISPGRPNTYFQGELIGAI
jgi:hypothetical protein